MSIFSSPRWCRAVSFSQPDTNDLFPEFNIDHCNVISVMVEIAHTSRDYAELSGRTQPVIGDVVVSLINLGISLQGITTYAKRENRPTISPPQQIGTQKPLSLLQAGTKLSHPSHIPHHLPPLPDPHAYIRTPVGV